MTVKSRFNGNTITYNEENNSWYYLNGELAIECIPCKKCNKLPTKDGHDDCIADLPGITNACCGHGDKGYLQFSDGTVIRGFFEIERHIIHKKD